MLVYLGVLSIVYSSVPGVQYYTPDQAEVQYSTPGTLYTVLGVQYLVYQRCLLQHRYTSTF